MSSIISAVVVTFNRLELLKQVIKGLRNQTRKLDNIIIINNNSSDGTEEWLSEQTDLLVFKQENIGSSGGQWRGSLEAYKLGSDYIWLMDDDVVSEPDCLEILCKFIKPDRIVTPLRYMNNQPYMNDVIYFNMSNPFKSIWKQVITNKDFENELIYAEGITFEGPIIPKEIFKTIGFPEKNFFIYADDTEYWVRALKNGFKTYVARDARLNRMIQPAANEYEFTWKHYYLIRNLIAIDKLHAPTLVKILRPVLYLFVWLSRAKNKDNFKTVIKSFIDGIKYKSSN